MPHNHKTNMYLYSCSISTENEMTTYLLSMYHSRTKGATRACKLHDSDIKLLVNHLSGAMCCSSRVTV